MVIAAVSLTESNTEIGFVDVGCLRLTQSFGTQEHSMEECQIETRGPLLPRFGDVQDMTELQYRNVQLWMATEEDCTSWWMCMEEMTAVAYVPPGENSRTGNPLENSVKTQTDVRSRPNMPLGLLVHAVPGEIGECRQMCEM